MRLFHSSNDVTPPGSSGALYGSGPRENLSPRSELLRDRDLSGTSLADGGIEPGSALHELSKLKPPLSGFDRDLDRGRLTGDFGVSPSSASSSLLSAAERLLFVELPREDWGPVRQCRRPLVNVGVRAELSAPPLAPVTLSVVCESGTSQTVMVRAPVELAP